MTHLKPLLQKYYLVKEGDTPESVCEAAGISFAALKKRNGIEELTEGEILLLPPSGNLYTVQPGDDVVTLCGSKERFEELNGTDVLFPGMKVRI